MTLNTWETDYVRYEHSQNLTIVKNHIYIHTENTNYKGYQQYRALLSFQEMCQLRGGHLVHVDDASEDRFIVSLMHQNKCKY